MTSNKPVIPASLFAIVLGLVGLGNDWRMGTLIWSMPPWVSETIMAIAVLVYLALVILYFEKWVNNRAAAVGELEHPIQCCFASLIPISTMLMAIVMLPYSRPFALVLFVVGAVGAVAFGVWRHGALWRGGRNPAFTTPVLYLPTVASNFVTAIGLGALGYPFWGQMFFGAGVLSWLAIESILVHRLFTAEELPPALRPTLGIQLAPPAVGLVAWLSVTTGQVSVVDNMLLGYALLQISLVGRLMPWISQQPFAPGYWGFTFGISAIALGAMRMTERSGGEGLMTVAVVLFVFANVAIGGLFIASIVQLLRGRFLPKPA